MGALFILMLVLVTMVSVAIYRFWVCINHLGQSKELIRLAPHMAALDGVAIFAAFTTLYFAALGWGFNLPLFFHDEPLADWQNIFMALACCFTCMGLSLKNAGRRFEHGPSWGGMRESAVRTLVAFRILDAIEISHAMKANGFVMDSDALEVRK
ncbi:hypothetical protein H2508_13040 [Parahaliea sp. F7430]|uniref:Uncharacterized protein n=1 Tax=Sediminihaliea albiluteola TaxID=2758564 RepID=A0A7W2TY09_9GAMM|nr:hypothetical protein [Sediminihaliea albiluteola]MBA6414038.1 hypothetical protein [Sediminihaliea albiluteola]